MLARLCFQLSFKNMKKKDGSSVKMTNAEIRKTSVYIYVCKCLCMYVKNLLKPYTKWVNPRNTIL